MRFIWAVAAFVLAALMIGAGIAQRTVFEGPKSMTSTLEVSGTTPYVLIDGAVLGSHPGSQTVRIEGDGQIFASYGRTADLEAWLARASYTHVTVDPSGVGTVAERVAASSRLPDDTTDTTALTPEGSDLWLDEFTGEDVLTEPLQLPADMGLLVAADGTTPAPGTISVTWPLENATPWAGPLIVVGGVLLAVGIVLYLLGVRHARRSRGPRRKGLPVPVTEPIDLAVESADKGVISAAPTRRQLNQGRRSLLAAPAAVVAAAAMLTGCSADAWPQFGSAATPSASASVVAPDDQQSPVVTQAQAERIIAKISDTVAQADAARDATVAATRLGGTALAVRETTYRLQAAIASQPALPAVPAGPLQVTLPEANEDWPRTFIAVAGADGGASTVMSVTQADAWSPYRIDYISALSSDAQLNVAPVYVGAIPIPADSPFLAIPPEELAAAYADVLTNGDNSRFAALFDGGEDAFRTQLDASRTERLDQFNQTGSQTGTMTFSAEAGSTPPVSLATLDSGAIVAVTVDDRDTVTPSNTEAVIKVDGDPPNPVVQTLTGVSQSNTGFVTTYATQLFFFVPSQSSQQRIQLLGYSSSILDAKVVG